jgi:hypothetical protein
MTKHAQSSAKTKTPIRAKTKAAPKRRSSTQSVAKASAAASTATGIEAPKIDPATVHPMGPARPGGKLGLIVDRLGDEAGMTIDELTAVTGWQAHTVRAALSRLRTRGFATHLERNGDRNAYQLIRQEG